MEEIDLENGEARVETDGLTVTEQVKRAYADAYGIDNGYDPDERCLSFLSDQWSDPEEVIQLVEYIGPYNAFDPKTVGVKLRTLVEEAHVDFVVAIAREGSPALYFATDEPEKIRTFFESYADDFSEVEASDLAGKERIREDDYSMDEHGVCNHSQPPVQPGHEVRGDPDSNLTYLRAWWD